MVRLKHFLTLLIALHFSLPCSAQITTNINESYLNTPLEVVLEDFNEKYQVLFAYNQQEIEGIYVHHYFENISLEKAVFRILEGSGMEYLKVGPNEYLIRKSPDRLPEPIILTGQILDHDMNSPLAWATVQDRESGHAAYTDENGKFKLRFLSDKNKGQIIINYLGYSTHQVNWSADQKLLTVQLESEPIELLEVEVVQRIAPLRVEITNNGYQQTVSLDKIQLGRAGVGDELSTMRFLPSVNATNDLNSGLKLRGGDETENLYLLDDIEFFNVGHFFGVFSGFEPLVVDSTRLFLTNFPVEYGGRTSGVVDMKIKNPTFQKFGGILDIHSLYTHAQFNIPITKKSGIILATRFTNGDVSETDIFDVLFQNNNANREISNPNSNSVILSIVPDYRFNDSEIKWNWRPDKNTSFSISVVGGTDKYIAAYDVEQETRFQQEKVKVIHSLNENMAFENGGINLSYDQRVTPFWETKLDISGSSQIRNQSLDARLQLLRKNGIDTVEVSNLTKNLVAGGEIKWNNYFHLNDRQKFTLGASLENHRSELTFPATQGSVSTKDTSINANLFLSHEMSLSENFDILLGMRGSIYSLTGKSYLSPRLAFDYRMNSHWSMGGSIGLYNQFLRSLVYEDRFGKKHDFWLLANDTVPVLRSLHTNLFFQYRKSNILFKAELFSKISSNELEQMWVFRGFDPDSQKPKVSRFEIFKGGGLSQGADFLFSYSHSFFKSTLAYTYSWNTIKIEAIDDGSPFPSPDDRRHELNLMTEFFWKKWTLGIGGVYGSGLPYVSALVVDGQDRRNLTVEETITRLPDYIRLDLALLYDFQWLKQDFALGLSVYNLLDRKNTDQIQYLYNIPQVDQDSGQLENTVVGNQTQLLPRTWDLQFKWIF